MNSRLLMILTLSLVALIGLWCGVRVHFAHQHLATVMQRCALERDQLQRCVDNGVLSAAPDAASAAVNAPAGDVVAQVQRALASAGVPAAAFRGVQPLADRPDASARVIEHALQVHLEGMRAADLGAWLATWCVPGQVWDITQIEWSHTLTATGSTLDNGAGFTSVSLRSRTPM